MTKQRNDNHSTEFGLWLRNEKMLETKCIACGNILPPFKTQLGRNPDLIDSKLGFTATNIDFLWNNYKNGKWLLIEEKRYLSEPAFWQMKLFKKLDKLCLADKDYKGFHLITFENTSPEDGKIYLNHISEEHLCREVDKDDLIRFLNFEIYWNVEKKSYFIIYK